MIFLHNRKRLVLSLGENPTVRRPFRGLEQTGKMPVPLEGSAGRKSRFYVKTS
jgi:hypothetical protein